MWFLIPETSVCGLSKVSGAYQRVAARYHIRKWSTCSALFNAVATVVIDCGSYVTFKIVAALVEKILSFG